MISPQKILYFAPYLDPLKHIATDFLAFDLPQLEAILRQRHGLEALQLKPQTPRPRGRKRRLAQKNHDGRSTYEQKVARENILPLRRSLHDLLNLCVWWQFPRTKMALSLAHALEQEKGAAQDSARGRRRDALTLFDEGGAVRVAVDQGEDFYFLFGHGLLEHLLEKDTVVHAATVEIKVSTLSWEHIDKALAQFVADENQIKGPVDFLSLDVGKSENDAAFILARDINAALSKKATPQSSKKFRPSNQK